MSEKIKDSVRILLADIIDYAGLFPPSGLSMPEAVINYATYKNSNYNWMLGRFICPVGRLDEFVESARDFISRDVKGMWRLSVLASNDIHETIRQVEDFNLKFAPGAVCDSLEIKADNASVIEKYADAIPDNFKNYFELPLGEDLGDLISALAVHKQHAKIRTGGITPDLFPTTNEIIRFMRTCLAANVKFKATAGLHHPIRCFKPLTYEPNAPKGTMHGFLNLFLATGYARVGFKPEILEELMEEEFEEVFEFTETGVNWQGDFSLTISQLQSLRDKNLASFGSCSFDEPIEDLQKIGLL
ncbi:MAG: hypothetical protein HKN25_01530 [Pyrinomonadaceae bacterium]|nr:hypothetical protein [Pyrinomonadaceae bacterium]